MAIRRALVPITNAATPRHGNVARRGESPCSMYASVYLCLNEESQGGLCPWHLLGGCLYRISLAILHGWKMRPFSEWSLCGGKWGDCCSRQGQCGAGDDFCSFDKCYSGNCIIPQPEWKAPWQVGDTPDGTCGDPNGYTCDVTFGNCCGFNGKCGSRVEHCGLGW